MVDVGIESDVGEHPLSWTHTSKYFIAPRRNPLLTSAEAGLRGFRNSFHLLGPTSDARVTDIKVLLLPLFETDIVD